MSDLRSHVLVLTWIGAHAEDSDSRACSPLGDRVDAVSSKLVDLRATVHFLLLEWSILNAIKKSQ